jgi:zinc/manganese transport system ATP-binding protein
MRPGVTRSDALLAVERLSVSLAGRRILTDVDFTLRAGEFCGLIGGNGSGKTTLIRTVLGMLRPDSGMVRIGSGAEARARVPLGYVPQRIFLDPQLPLRARDVVALGLDGSRLGLPLSRRNRDARVAEMLAAVGAEDIAERRVGTLSGGQQQRILIAHALIRRPPLLLLDEPLASLDVRSVAEIVALLNRLSSRLGTAVLLAAHDVNPLLPVMDRIVYLANGHAATGRTEEVVRTEVLSKLYGYHIDVVRIHGRVVVIAAEAPEEGHAALARDPTHIEQIP